MKFFLSRAFIICFSFCGAQGRTVEFVGHRGASRDAPENTLAAFRLGWQQTDACELDIHLTKDGQIVVLHDADTKRTTGVAGKVAEATLAELRALDAGKWKDARWAGEKIPTLAEVLTLQPERKRLFIEIKCGPEVLPELVRVVRAAHKQSGQVVLIGFSLPTMQLAKKLLPEVTALWIVSGGKKIAPPPKLPDLLTKARAAGLDGLDLDYRLPLDAAFVKSVEAAQLQLYIWTVDDPAVAKKMVTAGIKGITTNRPQWLREQLAAAQP
ncbi:MAG: glycerophosphodiester phosphodiesterase [Kiritimatiellaeota bacterium]|nr:glycerophosphodiester phosphodiesterase [Kiritimatiellota bacterium]